MNRSNICSNANLLFFTREIRRMAAVNGTGLLRCNPPSRLRLLGPAARLFCRLLGSAKLSLLKEKKSEDPMAKQPLI